MNRRMWIHVILGSLFGLLVFAFTFHTRYEILAPLASFFATLIALNI